ncbi:hypothetical protein [Novipirellula artificiosorum]|nr:hypothetical protein [Novipirellula artificiosorum]
MKRQLIVLLLLAAATRCRAEETRKLTAMFPRVAPTFAWERALVTYSR